MIKNEHLVVIFILASLFSACSPQYDAEERITSLEQPHSASTSTPAESAITSGKSNVGLVDLTGIKSGEVPEDIKEHLSYTQEAGGGIYFSCFPISESAKDISENIYVYSLPTGIAEWCFYEIDELINESIQAKLEMPDGSIQHLKAMVAHENGPLGYGNYARFEYQFSEVSDRKLHRFTTDLSGRHVEIQFIPAVKGYYFGGFTSNEKVRILIYKIMNITAEFHVELSTHANNDGDLWVEINDVFDQPPLIFAIGENTGCRSRSWLGGVIMIEQIRGSIHVGSCDFFQYKKP